MSSEESFDTIVIGGGQAGLAVGYYLKQRAKNYIILDENNRATGLTSSLLESMGEDAKYIVSQIYDW